eukprot:TRINITY_DN13889_c0_g2_i1.p1 TRINITY_DN13889_c0_g2~~TRINITY_DN13889_c0_g2_i1.p1  ORF type:complete len:129 (-),score=8.00 TRINITY_DN13889_c0_g2_i1:88-474(-)
MARAGAPQSMNTKSWPNKGQRTHAADNTALPTSMLVNSASAACTKTTRAVKLSSIVRRRQAARHNLSSGRTCRGPGSLQRIHCNSATNLHNRFSTTMELCRPAAFRCRVSLMRCGAYETAPPPRLPPS